jgi:hypothetical protein
MRIEYNFDYSKAVRGKYYRRLVREGGTVNDGSSIVVLDADVARVFRSSSAVNKALRTLINGGKTPRRRK